MSSYNNRLLECLDKMARLTRIPSLVEGPVRRRRMRILPILTLSFGTIGLAITFLVPGKYWFGYAIVMCCFGIANFFPMLGPVKQPADPRENVDERDQLLRRNAYFVAFAAVSVAALLSIWILIGITVLREWPRDALLRAMLALSFYLMSLISAVPTLYISWTVSELIEDGD